VSIPADLIERARSTRVEDVLARHSIRLNGRGVARSGPCPICAGTDRFAIDIGRGIFNCRKCGAKGAGAIDLEMFLAGHNDLTAAVKALAGEPTSRPHPRPAAQEEGPSSNGLGRPTAIYDYVDETGELLFQALRYEPPDRPKQFRQRAAPDQKTWSIAGVRIVPYRLPELVENIALGHLILVVEGEKDVETLRGLGVPATTNPMGAGKWREDFNWFFRGADVVICGDNDKPGRDHVETVARNLHGVAQRVRVLALAKFWPDIDEGGDVSDWFARGGGTVERLYEIVDELPDWTKPNGAAAPAQPIPEVEPSKADGLLIWYGDSPPAPPSYFVDEMLPEIGVAVVGGQYGAAKTFVGVDLVAATIAGGDFAGRAVRRQGGALWLAAEGESEIERRVYAAIAARGGDAAERQPFARQAGSVPCLTEKEAPERLKALTAAAAERLRKDFGRELALIVVDTLSAAAGFDDENSAAETQKVMTALAALARETRSLVLLIDHYGKLVDTGVRGSSAKSAAADAILACLGERDPATGATSNRRLAVAKLRAGPTGRIVPFSLAQTDDGFTCTVNWLADAEPESAPKGRQWPKALIIFKRALDEALDAAGKTTTPRAGMPEVKAVDREAVRTEFYRLYPGDAETKRQSFYRCVKDAVERGVMCSINVGPDLGQTIFWTP
jgi:AAA domain